MGRKPVGAELVQRVPGSSMAKQRMKVVIETMTGAKTMQQACTALAVEKSRLFQLRERALQAAVAALEPQTVGRPPQTTPQDAARVAALEQQVEHLTMELEATRLRLEVAQVLPHLGHGARAAGKKFAHKLPRKD
jgi:hypothetical protein